MIGLVTLAAITGTTKLVPYHLVRSQQYNKIGYPSISSMGIQSSNKFQCLHKDEKVPR